MDIIAILGTFFLAYYLRFYTIVADIFPIIDGIPDINKYIELALITLPIWVIILQTNQMYKLKRSVFIFDEFFSIFKSSTLSVLLSMGILFFIRSFTYSRVVLVLIWIIAPLLIVLFRYFILKLEKTLYNKGKHGTL